MIGLQYRNQKNLFSGIKIYVRRGDLLEVKVNQSQDTEDDNVDDEEIIKCQISGAHSYFSVS